MVLPAKLFDYLASGSKIVALAEEGATLDLITETKSGRCFSPSDVAGLRDYLYSVIKAGNLTDFRNEPKLFLRYDVKRVTERLAVEMSALT